MELATDWANICEKNLIIKYIGCVILSGCNDLHIFTIWGYSTAYIRTKIKQLMNLLYISTISDHIETKA